MMQHSFISTLREPTQVWWNRTGSSPNCLRTVVNTHLSKISTSWAAQWCSGKRWCVRARGFRVWTHWPAGALLCAGCMFWWKWFVEELTVLCLRFLYIFVWLCCDLRILMKLSVTCSSDCSLQNLHCVIQLYNHLCTDHEVRGWDEGEYYSFLLILFLGPTVTTET